MLAIVTEADGPAPVQHHEALDRLMIVQRGSLAGIRFAQCVDIDGSGTTDALTDGLMLLRAMFGPTGVAVTNGAVAANATRAMWADIRGYLYASCGTSFGP